MQPSLQAAGIPQPGRCVRRGVAGGRRLPLHRGVPGLAADPQPVQRPAADPAGAQAAQPGGGGGADPPPGPGVGSAELVRQRDPPAVADAIGFPDPIVYDIKVQVAQHSFTSSQVLPIDAAGPADPVVRRERQHVPGRHRPDPAAVDHLRRSTGLPGPDDQRRVRQAGAGPVQQPPGREPAEPGPAGLRGPGAAVPDPPAQRAHGAGVGRQPALRVPVRPEGPRLPGQVVRGPAVPELAGRQRQPGEAELLLVPRPRDGLHRRPTSTRAWSGSTRSTTRRTTSTPATRPRACGCPECGPTTPTAPSTSSTTSRWRSTTSGWTTGSRSTRTSTTGWASSRPPGTRARTRSGGASLLQALPQPRLRRRHLHRQRHRVPDAGGQAAQVPVPVPGLLDLPDLRVPADDLDQRAEGGPRPRLRRRGGPAGPVPDRGRPAGHELDRDRHRRRSAAVPDHPGHVRAVAGEAA